MLKMNTLSSTERTFQARLKYADTHTSDVTQNAHHHFTVCVYVKKTQTQKKNMHILAMGHYLNCLFKTIHLIY